MGGGDADAPLGGALGGDGGAWAFGGSFGDGIPEKNASSQQKKRSSRLQKKREARWLGRLGRGVGEGFFHSKLISKLVLEVTTDVGEVLHESGRQRVRSRLDGRVRSPSFAAKTRHPISKESVAQCLCNVSRLSFVEISTKAPFQVRHVLSGRAIF